MEYIKTCPICNKDFKTYNSAKDICPGECRKTASKLYAKEFMRKKRLLEKEVINKTCVICKKDFESHKILNKVICFDCELAKHALPIKQYDETHIDNEGIIYGITNKQVL